jgi:hypothetical protein
MNETRGDAAMARAMRTPEQMVDEWLAGQAQADADTRERIRETWEAGCVPYVVAYGARYERYWLDGGGYVVIEWDDSGNMVIA